jgi:hypothetical protein
MNRSILRIVFPATVILLFVLFSCTKKDPLPSRNTSSPTTTGSSTSTTGNPSLDHDDSLTGSTWVLYQYRDQYTTTPLPRTDTLIFTNATTYTWNGVQQTYRLKTQDNIYNKYVFSLNNTPFGTLRGLIPLTMKQYGEVINEPFSQTAVSSPQTFFMWFRKIN